jgi:GDP-mannose 6-dehydrogenase
MIVQIASRAGVELPLMRAILASNEAHLKRAIEAVPKNGHARIGFNGLAFKAGTDDLRESPIVLIAEHLIGKGYDVKIHDQGIEASLITGANREYIQRHIPHLSSRLVRNAEELVEHSEVLLITRDDDRLQEAVTESGKKPIIVDLRGKTTSRSG